MKIELINGLYVATCAQTEAYLFREGGWYFERLKHRKWVTEDWKRVLTFHDYAVGDAKLELDDLVAEREAALNASYAMYAEADIPCPEMYNHKGERLDYLPYQKAGILYACERSDTLIADSPGLGKGQPLWAKVLTPSGWRLMGDLVVGDPIIGSDGQTHHVTGIFDKGILPFYRIEFNDGAVTHVDGDHLWKIRRKRIKMRSGSWYAPDWEIMETRDLISRAYPGGIQYNKIEIPQVSPVHYDPVDLPLDPYLVGALLGDGGLTQTTPYFSNIDQGVMYNVMTRLPKGYVARLSDRCSYRIVPEKAGTSSRKNAVTGHLRSLNMMGKGADSKSIPSYYLFASPEDRLLLLQGLLDTDGYCAKDGTVQFSSNSSQLRDEVVELVQSIGGTARKSQKISASGKDHFITTINSPVCPFLGSTHKVDRWKPRKKYEPKRIFKTISPVGEELVRCISVSAPDRLYITDDFIVTHNTIQAVGVINYLDLTSGLIVCPSTLKLNWEREMKKWLVDKSLTVGVAYGNDIPKTDFVIINYDILARNKEALQKEEWGILICDEAQYLQNPASARTKVIFGEWYLRKEKRDHTGKITRPAKEVRSKPGVSAWMRLMLTGTPMMKRPKDLWPMIRDFDSEGLGSSFYNYALEYCDGYEGPFGLVADGGSNLDELNEKLRRTFMIRRLKSHVLKDLPPKTRQVVLLPAEGLKKRINTERDKFTEALAMLSAANDNVVFNKKTALEEVDPGFILDSMATILGDGFNAAGIHDLDAGEVEPGFAAFSEARHELALSKVPMAVEHIKRLLEADEKVIVFAIHRDVVAQLYEAFPQAARIIGGMSPKKVEAEKLRFQGDKDLGIEPDPTCNIILGNLKAAGVGHTLTEATVVVFVEMWSVPGDMEQCEDRAHRYGLEHNVLVQYLVVDGTMDARTIDTLIKRIEMIQRGVDGPEPTIPHKLAA